MVVATGFFDGVHCGHRLTIGRLVEVARSRNEESLVVTFWPHPRTVLQKDASTLRLLNSLEEKKRLLKAAGVDRIEVIEFTREFSRLTAEQYIRQYLVGRFGATAVVLGYDNKFGSDCADVEAVRVVAQRMELDVYVGQRLSSDAGTAVSSTWIRTMISAGEMEAAAGMLGYRYSLRGVVVAGNKLGRTIGFPTANMQLYDPLKLVPGNGAYFVKVNVVGRELYGMCNVGNRPTVGPDSARTIETNIFDFDEDIYGLDIEVTYLKKIRDEVKFGSMDALRQQLVKDRETCGNLIS